MVVYIVKVVTEVQQGRIQRLKKEGGAHIEWEVVWPCSACRFFCARIMHIVLGGCGGMLPQENFLPYESASEAIGDHHNHAKIMATGL